MKLFIFVFVALLALVVAEKPYVCIFLMGVGQADPTDDLSGDGKLGERATFIKDGDNTRFDTVMPNKATNFDYWQGVLDETHGDYVAKYCDPYFYRTETILRGWDSNLQNEYCLAISSLQAVKQIPIIVFTHSMGNLILSAAIGNNIKECSGLKWQTEFSEISEQKNAAWFGLQGPLLGSEAENLADSICHPENQVKGNSIFDKIQKKLGLAVEALESRIKECKGGYSTCVTTYRSATSKTQISCKATDKDCKTLQSVAKQYMLGNTCGVATKVELKTFGVQFIDSFGLWTLHHIVNWKGHSTGGKAECDGMVSYASCSLPDSVYVADPTNRYFRSQDNHSQGRCYQKATDQTCSYMVNMLKTVAPLEVEEEVAPETETPKVIDPKKSLLQMSKKFKQRRRRTYQS